MSNSSAPTSPPQAVLAQMINGYWATGCICAVASLGLADAIGDAPRTPEAIATELGLHARSLARLLRACASLGVFAENDGGAFAHTPLSRALRSDVPGSMRGLGEMTAMLHLRAWPEIAHSIRTGGTAFEKVFGAEIFDYLPANPEPAAVFDRAFAGYTAGGAAAVASVYDFSRFGTLVDVGGGNGALCAAILERTPGLRGVTFDRPDVAPRAKAFLAARGLADRCEVAGGDFFESVPSGADAYALKMILHDWDDARCVQILRNIRKAIAPGGRILVMEAVVEGPNAGPPAKLLDINMLVMTGGEERTREEYAALFAKAGFVLDRVVPASPTVAVIEARPA
ncbi:MAG TPA: methyltransferase [Kofleriaceae bacterium]|nr:methyltransferase [Kofleriaceae bacterium]